LLAATYRNRGGLICVTNVFAHQRVVLDDQEGFVAASSTGMPALAGGWSAKQKHNIRRPLAAADKASRWCRAFFAVDLDMFRFDC